MNNIIRIKDRGSFHIGGEKIKIEDAPVEEFNYMDKFTYSSDPNGTHWAKQMYVQYSIIDGLKAPYPILMWHGGGLTGVTWETTPDGREGWDTLFLRYGYDVYVSDAVERGRSSWAKFPEVNETPPIFHSYEGRWLNLKMGEVYPTPYEGLRFPVEYYDNLMKQSVPRWLSSDDWAIDAYSKYIEKMQKEVDGVIILAHSQGAGYAQKIVQKYQDFIKAVIMIEPIVLPDNKDIEPYKKIPQLYVYGDFMSDDYKVVHTWVDSIRKNKPVWTNALDEAGADYTWLELPQIGIKGNSHMLMMDNNNDKIAELINQWLIDRNLGPKDANKGCEKER